MAADLAELQALLARLVVERDAAQTRKERRALSSRVKVTRTLIAWRKDVLARFPKVVRVFVAAPHPDNPDRA